MNQAIIYAAITVGATALGGVLALRSKDRFHLVLGLSAGLLLGLVGFELLPEIFELNASTAGGIRVVSLALVGGFLALHIIERLVGSHEPAESDYGHAHEHRHVTGTISAVAMAGHIFLDGLGLAVAFKVSTQLGLAVFVAVLVHAFSDGLNTVSMLIKEKRWTSKSRWLIALDAVARLAGATLGSTIALSDSFLSFYLALFSGFVIYIATSHILPEAHSRHQSRWTLVATVLGVLVMWLVISAG